MNPQPSQSAPDFGDRLVQFEAEWSGEQIPDVAGYLRAAGESDREFIEDLIEIDLECRWKQFGTDSDPSGKDPHGFPLFPLVDDYGSLLPEPLQQLIFTPRCIAEEYRVRSRWGDKPSKHSFFERFPGDRTEIEGALNAIDTDFDNEGIEVSEESSLSVAAAARSTVILGQSDRKDSTLVPESELTGTQIGKYRLDSRLGHGAFGEVWKAYDPVLKRHVAIKFPRSDKHFPEGLLETFRTEAQKLASLDHIPGIVDVFDCGDQDGKPYFVSKYIDGESLACRMQRERLSQEDSVTLIAKVANTLKRAHQQKLVHRDIKPANILLNAAGEPYLADFGMAATEDEQLSEGGGILGTFAYMAPEQARGDSHRVDGRADIYALGVILYRLLTNELPYGGKTIEQYLNSIQHQKPRPPRQIDDTIPAELERICLKCLKKDEDERYSSAGELARELRHWKPPGRHITYVIITAAFLLLVSTIGLVSTDALHDWLTAVDSSTPSASGKSQSASQTTRGEGDLPTAESNTIEGDDHDLLNNAPIERVFLRERVSNKFYQDPKTKYIHLKTDDFTVITCGDIDVRNRTLIIVIESQSQLSHIGFFWGLHREHNPNDELTYAANGISAYIGDETSTNKLTVDTITLVPRADNLLRFKSLSTPWTTPFNIQLHTTWTIQLQFDHANPKKLIANDREYIIDSTPTGPLSGEVGLYATTGDFVIRQFYWE